MKKFIKSSILTVFTFSFVLSFIPPIVTDAAMSPSLGTAASYSILAGSAVTNTGATTVSGDVGISPGTTPPDFTGFGTVTLGGTVHDADAPALAAEGDKNTAYANLGSQGCDTDFGGVTTELAGKNLVPGVYCSASFHLTSGTLTLNGSASDVWIFKSGSDLVVTGGNATKVVFTGGGLPCNVWWRVVSTASLDAGSSLVGNILADTGITFAAGANLDGRALARTAAVTLSSNSITGPTCTASPTTGTLHVIKVVVNGPNSTAVPSNFNIHVKSSGTDVLGSPASGTAAPGTSYTLSAGTYVISEDSNSSFVQTFSGDCNSGGSVTLASGNNKICTITNTSTSAIGATLHVVKVVVNGPNSTAVASNFNLHVKNSGVDITGSPFPGASAPGTSFVVPVGTYTVSEDPNSSFVQTFSGDCSSTGSVTLTAGNEKTCTVTNTSNSAIGGTLHVVKVVVNGPNSTAVPSNFNIHVKNAGVDVTGSPASGTAAPGTSYVLPVGTYTVSEDLNSSFVQTISGDCNSIGSVTLAAGNEKTCTVTNTSISAIGATLHVVKVVVNGPGSTAVPSNFNLHVKSSGIDITGSPFPGAATPGTSFVVPVGTYTVSEDPNSSFVQTFSGDCSSTGSVTLAAGNEKICTVTNTSTTLPPPATFTLHVIKVVVNGKGGTAVPSNFSLHVKNSGADVLGSPAPGAGTPGTAYLLQAGVYVVSEDANPLFKQTFSGDCDSSGNVTLAAVNSSTWGYNKTSGKDKTCTITNTALPRPATLHVIKLVLNGKGEKAIPSNFTLHVKDCGKWCWSGNDVAGSPAPGEGAPGTAYLLLPGAYAVSEDANASYKESFLGDCDSTGAVTLSVGNNKTCVIINTSNKLLKEIVGTKPAY